MHINRIPESKMSKSVKTPEEIKEEKKIYMRNYMKNRRANDPDFLLKQKELARINEKKKYDTNPEYREKKNEDGKQRYAKYKEAFLKMNETPNE